MNLYMTVKQKRYTATVGVNSTIRLIIPTVLDFYSLETVEMPETTRVE